MHAETAKWLQQVLTSSNYVNKDRIYEEFDEILTQYNGLNPKFDRHVFGGCFYNLLGMTGVIPVTYRNVTYNIPIGVWVMFDYPLTPPEFVVMPTESMKIVVGKHVKPDGIITHPYLDTYSSKPQYSMMEFISILRQIFSNETPVVAVKQPVKPPTSQSFNMPQPVSMPMPRPNSFMYNNNNDTGNNNMPYNYSFPQPSYSTNNNANSGNVSSSTSSLNRPTNTKTSVLNEVRDKINKDIDTINDELKLKIDELLDENKKLSENETKINKSMDLFREEMLKIKSNITVFQGKNREISEKIEQLKNKKEINPDDILKLTPLMNQLVETIADESAIEDMIYYLGKALTSEQINLNYYLKHIRALSREQFLKKVLIKKIRAQAQLM
ncbi:UEV-domain-containing protein [Neocallimastix lanati (nom. inval.)]|jgi:ESCRT-I complex subunit TSG101|uniref:UEV-domain-containing protein n=1 Tax=Neocallimastix californiae TaxID=1754190 RepID=A0A1Y2DR58_9FUNG|nr:UEV-domain-containing protein [Neocallimastix sp. JGI-2020a]ORY61145.1 UEV-domain-containing protein [Neocallimastix californiae]|eukprot:ORY61145.1 UEV-domain-containing protein [Neocallimastix californiae]